MNVYVLFHEYIVLIIIGLARILPITLFLPWFNSQILGGMIVKNVIMCFMIVGMLPILSTQFSLAPTAPMLTIIIQEAIIGLICGICLAVPFWIALAIGEIIDNQRGATISSTMNPGVGVETSVFASFMNYFYGATFMLSGGMVTLCEAIKESYQIFPVAQTFHFSKTLAFQGVHFVNEIMLRALILVGPVVIALFITECALGLLSRFASQLNAFSVALALKSVVAIVVLLFYLTPLLIPQLTGLRLGDFLPGR
ncbi:type III secretion system export apparatus subunit SctT [Citrobacter sp. U14242]|uniref:type III secretion system export apparatus subunit SctT n=1 Tax=Citrobacter sp. U14242 TaxID=3390192 RepID=UPI00397AABB7